MKIITNTVEETEEAGYNLAKGLTQGAVVTLYGDLGAGKTAFVRGMARGLNSPSRVTSPTFTIVNEYYGDLPLFHFDMYRLGSSSELFDIGWEDYLVRGGICVVEWSENVSDAFDGSEIIVRIDKLSDTERIITVEDNINENTGL